jgi:hypothetical protein
MRLGNLDAPGVTVTVIETDRQWEGECSDCGWMTNGPSEVYVKVWSHGHLNLHAALERRNAKVSG